MRAKNIICIIRLDYGRVVHADPLVIDMWAPDVIYNENMGKYCMYMSVNGDDWNSVITLLTADEVEGPYEYVGPVIYSGFNTTTHPAEKTDVYKVLGEGADLTRYQSTSENKLNAIDPCDILPGLSDRHRKQRDNNNPPLLRCTVLRRKLHAHPNG